MSHASIIYLYRINMAEVAATGNLEDYCQESYEAVKM
jgi:hypothetical protein